MVPIVLALMSCSVVAKPFCEKVKLSLEMGTWNNELRHLDSVAVENKPVSMVDGQTYVYQNTFPDYHIKYINVANLAVKTCGATASLLDGGVGWQHVLVLLRAAKDEEIRAVIDIWGSGNRTRQDGGIGNSIKMQNLFNNMRVLNHN